MRRCGFLRHALSAGMLYAGQIWSAQSLSMILSSASFRFAGRTHGFLKREWWEYNPLLQTDECYEDAQEPLQISWFRSAAKFWNKV